MAKKGRAVNKRVKPGTGRPPLGWLVVVVAVIVAAFLFLEWTRGKAPAPKAPPAPQQPAHLKLPERPEPQPRLSTAALPPVKAPVATRPLPHATGPGKLAIIIDDMGSSQRELQSLLAVKLPLTFSVIPSLAHAKGVAQKAHEAGAEVMVHMPMEPKGYPKQTLEKIGVLVAMDDAEIARRVEGYFAAVPFAAGANNHMGSRFTESPEKMEAALRVLKEKGVFFVDSRTSPASVGYRKARDLGLRCGVRQVFLDNVQDVAAIGKQLNEAAAIARKRGGAIAIGHPHPATIRALQTYMPQMAKDGITFVFASALTS